MSKREVKRNGRGQIISYEIEGANDSGVDSQTYGDVVLNSDESYTKSIKHPLVNRTNRPFFNTGQQPLSISYNTYTDTEFSDEFINEVDIKEPRDAFAQFDFEEIAKPVTGNSTTSQSTTTTTGLTGPTRPTGRGPAGISR